MKICRYFDSAVLKPNLTREETIAAIQTAIDENSYTVCVRGCDIPLAVEMTKGTETGVSCVLDFPYGYGGAEVKKLTAEVYCRQGVQEIDMVMNIGAALSGDWETVTEEVRGVVEVAHAHNVGVKVIFETSQLDIETIKGATEACIAAGADFVKTSTGFNGEGATFEAVQAMLDTAKGRCKVKPSGGIRNYETAKRYIDMGAERLGIGYTSAHAISAGGEVDNSENY